MIFNEGAKNKRLRNICTLNVAVVSKNTYAVQCERSSKTSLQKLTNEMGGKPKNSLEMDSTLNIAHVLYINLISRT